MDDTALEIKAEVHHRMMRVSGETRMIMGSRMFDVCRDMERASFPEDLSHTELRLRLFERLYGREYNEDEKMRVMVRIMGE